MAYSRDTALVYLTSEFDALATEAGLPVGVDGWKVVLDKALRQDVGGDEESQEALLDFHALKRISIALSPRTSISKTTAGGTVQKSRNQAFQNVAALLKDAKETLADLDLTPAKTWITGTLDTDAYEPDQDYY